MTLQVLQDSWLFAEGDSGDPSVTDSNRIGTSDIGFWKNAVRASWKIILIIINETPLEVIIDFRDRYYSYWSLSYSRHWSPSVFNMINICETFLPPSINFIVSSQMAKFLCWIISLSSCLVASQLNWIFGGNFCYIFIV